MKKITISMLIIALLLFTACVPEEKTASIVESTESSGSNTETKNSSATTNEQTEPVEKNDPVEPARTEFYINELVEMGDLVVSLNGITEGTGEGFFEPDEGNKYVTIDLTFYNIGVESYSLSSLLGFELVDNELYTYDPSWTAPTKGKLDGTILPGRMLRGQVAFEIPENSIATELLFDYDLFISGQLIFKLDPDKAVLAEAYDNPIIFKDTYKISEAIETDDFTLVVNSFKLSEGSEYFGPDEGNIYYLIDVTITNKSTDTQTISTMMMFDLQDELGYTYDLAMMADTKGDIGGDLASGRSNRGEVAYEVPENQEKYYLIFEPGVFDSEQYIIEVK